MRHLSRASVDDLMFGDQLFLLPSVALVPSTMCESTKPFLTRTRYLLVGLSSLLLLIIITSASTTNVSHYTRLFTGSSNSLTVSGSLEASHRAWKVSVKKRKALLKHLDEQATKPPAFGAEWGAIWDLFHPSFNCPYPIERLGKIGEGGKNVCGVEQLNKVQDCVIYAFGIKDDSSFESGM